jgi:sugar phosphate isomerase/epimerase
MNHSSDRQINLSFFMFTANLQPTDPAYAQVLIKHLTAMTEVGYRGFDLPIAAQPTFDHRAEVDSYRRLKDAFVEAGFERTRFTTNVGTTCTFDPTSPYAEQRAIALAYLKSRVEITHVLGGQSIMAGPFLFPYGVFATTDANEPLWSDALQDWLKPRYRYAAEVFDKLGDFAEGLGVKLGIEPVDHWETPAPNTVSDVLDFLKKVRPSQTGVTIDSAHVVLGSTGPEVFRENVTDAVAQHRLHYVHISPPDRGALKDSWIPWQTFLPPILPVYDGPLLVEVFNAIPPFVNLMRLSRRKFWIPGEDAPVSGTPSAYVVAREGLEIVREQIKRFDMQTQ